MKLRCRWNRHDWFPWSEAKETRTASFSSSLFSMFGASDNKTILTTKITRAQERMCGDCRMVERRVLSEEYERE